MEPKVHDANYALVVLEEWVRGMEKIFTMLEVSEEKKVNTGTHCLIGEAHIWWNTIKDKLVRPKSTWSKFQDQLREKFYPVVDQRQKEKEFMELKMSGNMTVM